jgi:hypothetical protein
MTPARAATVLLGELVAATVPGHKGRVGVIVRDVGAPDPGALLKGLAAIHADPDAPDLRIAYLDATAAPEAKQAGLDGEVFSTEIEQAERWRNERDLTALVVVVAAGDEAKLSSLEDFGSITARDLRLALRHRALAGPANDNDVQGAWWRILSEDHGIGLGQLVDYYLSLDGKQGEAYGAAAATELHRLGLLPDPGFFDDHRPKALEQRLAANKDLVTRLQTLTPKDRRVIKSVIDSEQDAAVAKQSRTAFAQLLQTRWDGRGMEALDYASAERLIKARKAKKKSGSKSGASATGSSSGTKTRRAVQLAAESLIDPAADADLDATLKTLQTRFADKDYEQTAQPQRVTAEPTDVEEKFTVTGQFDLINTVTKLVGDGIYGGLLESGSDDLKTVLRRFNAQEDVARRWTRADFEPSLTQLAATGTEGATVAALFRTYDEARTAVLEYLPILASEPLVVAANPVARGHMLAAVEAYRELADGLRKHYNELAEAIGPDADDLIAWMLLLDLIVVKAGGGAKLYALPSPIHPLFIWHYAEFARIVEEQRDRLSERDRELIASAASDLPNFLTSIFVPAPALGQGVSLNAVGRVGALPYYAEEVEANTAEDGVETVTRLISTFVDLEPHAKLGFRLALIDPPVLGAYLNTIRDLAENGTLNGAHVVAFRPRGGVSVELGLGPDDEDHVANLFRALNMRRDFTFEVREIAEDDFGPSAEEPFHLSVVFDRGRGQANRVQPTTHPIQPLAMQRELRYRTFRDQVELAPAPGGLFASYNNVVRHVSDGGGSYLPVHQDSDLQAKLGALRDSTAWLAIADRRVDRDLKLGERGALRVFTTRERERDVAAFAFSPIAFRRPLRDVARNYNTYVSDDDLDGLLNQLSMLLDDGLFGLRPDSSGRANHGRVKGLLGTLIAARWYRGESPEPAARLLTSLDSADARRWMHLSDDPLRADLFGLEWKDGCCIVTVFEVKAVDTPAAEYRIVDGVVSGPAVDQALATRRLLAEVLQPASDDELITTPARREVLREHLYRELTKPAYDGEERKLWSERVQQVLGGEVEIEVRCELIDVRLGVASESLAQPRNVTAVDGDEQISMRVVGLNELHVEGLEQTAPPEGATGPEGDDSATADEEPEDVELAPVPASEPAPEALEPESPKAATAPPRPDDDARPRALLGMTLGEYGEEQEIWFDPALPNDPLPNPHVSITGETGSGKTQLTKAIVADLKRQALPALILDFKDDYSDPAYAEEERLDVYDASFDGLPFNPLTPAVDSRHNRINPAHHIHQLTEIVKRIYKLGDQQAYRLREAIKVAYDRAGVPTGPTEMTKVPEFPPFENVRDVLVEDKANEALLGRLSPIFDLGLFSTATADADLDAFLQASSVIRLGQLPGDETKNSVAEFFLMALYNFLVRQPHVHQLRRLLVLDEAWRLVESPFLIPLMREGRAFGLGVIIATQFPRDLPEAVRGSTATSLYFSQGQLEQVREIQRTTVGRTSGKAAEEIATAMRGLSPLNCLLHSKQFERPVKIAVKPYFERHTSD